jgi:3-methyl-2-oxobutanoate hydroxymethyltransferase
VRIAEEALALQAAGCFSIVFEAVPAAISEVLVPKLTVPVIGIGAGAATDGQVLVWHDLLGIYGGHQAKFVKRYANLRAEMLRGVGEYAREVRERAFPGPEHTYSIDPEELDAFRRYLDQESLSSTFGGDWSATEI